MEYITITEAARRMGKSTRTVRYMLENNRLSDNGKVGKGRRVKWEDDRREKKETLDDAKRRKIIAEANLAEQKHMAEQKRLFDEWTNSYFTAFAKAFAPFKNKIIELRLDGEKTRELNRIYQECMNDLTSELSSISPLKNL